MGGGEEMEIEMGKRGLTYAQDTGHGRNVQTEETTTDTCKGTYDVLEKERERSV